MKEPSRESSCIFLYCNFTFLHSKKCASPNHKHPCSPTVRCKGHRQTHCNKHMGDYTNIWRATVTPKRQWFGQESHLSALQSTSADKHSGCKSNTLRPGKPTATTESPLMNLITGVLKQQASYSQQNLLLSSGRAAFCPAENSVTIGLCVHYVGGIFPLHCGVHSNAELGPWGFLPSHRGQWPSLSYPQHTHTESPVPFLTEL